VFEVLRRFQQRLDFGLAQDDRQLLLITGKGHPVGQPSRLHGSEA